MNERGGKAKSAFFRPGTKSEIWLLCLSRYEIGTERCKLLLFTFVPAPEPRFLSCFQSAFLALISKAYVDDAANIVSTQYALLIYQAAQLAQWLEFQICHDFFSELLFL